MSCAKSRSKSIFGESRWYIVTPLRVSETFKNSFSKRMLDYTDYEINLQGIIGSHQVDKSFSQSPRIPVCALHLGSDCFKLDEGGQ